MSRPISLFSGYSQKENRTTNYCLLILKMMYEENPKYLSEVMTRLLGEDMGNTVGVQFHQQVKKQSSTPDGLIFQPSFVVYVETKNFDWFYDSQIERHLDGLHTEVEATKIFVALGNFESDVNQRVTKMFELCRTKFADRVKFAALSFEEFLLAIEAIATSKNLKDLIDDFRDYLDGEQLLSSWKTTMDVVNCATMGYEQTDDRVYLCPATGGAYNHRRAKFFGMYKNKRVAAVCLIEAVVELNSPQEAVIKWNNTGRSESELIEHARKGHQKYRTDRYPERVFVLGPLAQTNFEKSTPGGMLGSKVYFQVNAESAEELARQLSGRTWSDWRG